MSECFMDYNKNYYQILGVDKSCNEQDIKKAFRTLSKTHHPDKGGDANKFKEINEANSILSDAQKRNQYDNNSPHGKSYRPSNFGGFGGGRNDNANPFESYKTNFGFDINDFFRKSGFGHRYERIIEDLDIELTINIPLEEIYNNKSREFTYIRNVPCTTCDGTGEVPMDGHISCHHCNASGRVMNPNGRESICTNCSGSGKINKKICTDCSGSKLRMKKETLPLSNLFILSESQRTIAYNGYGHYSKHYKGEIGKLILNLIPLGNDKYKKVGKDLYYKTKIDFKMAILGGKLEYEHLDGKVYSITIPEKTNTDARFKLKEKGLMITPQGNRGDLYIDIDVYINYDKLSEADISVIKSVQ